MKYPIIDREQVSFESDTMVCNIGYYEGTLDDDRPIRVEVWSSYGIINATIFISSIDLEKRSEREIKQYLEKNNIIKVIEDKILIGDNRRELIEQYTNLEHLNREIVDTLIDYISIGKRIPGTRDVPIEIHWNF